MDIFGSVAPGTVKAVTVYGANGAMSFSSSIIPRDIVVTSVGYSGRSAVQIMHSLGKATYYYTFGIRNEVLVITGIVFARECLGKGGSKIDHLISRFRKAAEAGTVVTVSSGSTYRGLVDSLRTTWSDPDMGMLGFELRMHIFGSGAMTGSP